MRASEVVVAQKARQSGDSGPSEQGRHIRKKTWEDGTQDRIGYRQARHATTGGARLGKEDTVE